MTNDNRKSRIRDRMAGTGESYTEAQRMVNEELRAQKAQIPPRTVYVSYTLTLRGEAEFGYAEWADALSNERKHMIERAAGEQLDDWFDVVGGEGIAQGAEGDGQLDYTVITDAEVDAEYNAEAIELAGRLYAGIEEYEDWPDDVARPIIKNCLVTPHNSHTYVVLRRDRHVLAVYDLTHGEYTKVESWPKEIERW